MRTLTFAAALMTLAASSPAQTQARIVNMAPTPREQWVDVAIPASTDVRPVMQFKTATAKWLAIAGPFVGSHSRIMHVLRPHDAPAIAKGQFWPADLGVEAPTYTPSTWVTDRLQKLRVRPVMWTKVDGKLTPTQPEFTGAPRLVESSPARTVWHVRALIGGVFVWDSWAYIYTDQDVVGWEALLTVRPPDEAMSVQVEGISLESGEYLHLDYLKRMGAEPPVRMAGGDWRITLTGPRGFGRAESIPLQGALLALPDSPRPIQDALGESSKWDALQRRLDTLRAASEGPVLGVCTTWEGHWHALGYTPHVPVRYQGSEWAQATQRANGFANYLQVVGDLFEARPLGLAKSAGQTGGQEDFGAAHGVFLATIGDPRRIYELGWSAPANLGLRPFHNREANGALMRFAQHQALHTWSQLPWKTGTDYLGWPENRPWSWPGAGYTGIDDQHRSQNRFNDWLSVTGSYMGRMLLQDVLEIDLAMVPGRSGAARAQGRLQQSWATMLMLLDDEKQRDALRAQMLDKLANAQRDWVGGNLSQDRPMRPLVVGSDPSLLDVGGNRIPAVIMWEHSIAAQGYYAAWKATGEQGFRDMALACARLVVDHGVFERAGVWYCCTAVAWDAGRALPAADYRQGSGRVNVNNGWWEWILPAVIVAEAVGDTALQDKAKRIVQSVAPQGPASWGASAWWALKDWRKPE